MVERSLDLDADRWRSARRSSRRAACPATALPPPGQRIALAEDAAFSFLYPHVARQWRAAGAELVPFSPLADEAAAAGLRRLLAARRLSRAACRPARCRVDAFAPACSASPRRGPSMASAAASWCSARRWRTQTARRHRMLGLLGHATSFARRKMNLGYRAGAAAGRLPARRGRRDDPRPRIPLCAV